MHALHDRRATHLLAELSDEVDALSCSVGRPLTLIAESDLNDPRMVRSRDAGGYGMTAQWNDDVHHALHTRRQRRAATATTPTSPGCPPWPRC